ncbi:MAG: hypothetical protein ACTSVA_00180, partial [Candidatus Njordarchaeales archaeon]
MVSVEEVVEAIAKRTDILEKLAKMLLPELEKSVILRELRELKKAFQEEQRGLREDFNKMLARIEAIEAEQRSLREEQKRLREDFNK